METNLTDHPDQDPPNRLPNEDHPNKPPNEDHPNRPPNEDHLDGDHPNRPPKEDHPDERKSVAWILTVFCGYYSIVLSFI